MWHLCLDMAVLLTTPAASPRRYVVSEGLNGVVGVLTRKMRIDENVTMRMDVHGTPAENLQQLIRDCGVSPHKVRLAQNSTSSSSCVSAFD